jgi:hypothetical protein
MMHKPLLPMSTELDRHKFSGPSAVPIDAGQSLIGNNHSIELIVFSREFSKDNIACAASDGILFRSADRGDSRAAVQRPVRPYRIYRIAIELDGEASVHSPSRRASQLAPLTCLHLINYRMKRGTSNIVWNSGQTRGKHVCE